MRLIAIDPGPLESAWVLYDTAAGVPLLWAKQPNAQVLAQVKQGAHDAAAIEVVASYGMPVGADVFETCIWIGRFLEHLPAGAVRVFRRQVKLHLCGNPRANDATIRQALIDRYGGVEGKAKAIGRKACPGPLYGLTGDCWSALAVACTVADQDDMGAAA